MASERWARARQWLGLLAFWAVFVLMAAWSLSESGLRGVFVGWAACAVFAFLITPHVRRLARFLERRMGAHQ